MSEEYTLGINSAYHEPAVAVVHDGQIITAVEEERFNRNKHGKRALVDDTEPPFHSLDFCLKDLGGEITAIGNSFNPIQRYMRNVGLEDGVKEGGWGSKTGERTFYEGMLKTPTILEARYNWDSDQNDWVGYSKDEWSYDTDGNQTLCVIYYWDSDLNDWVGIGKYEYSYDQNGNQTLQVSYNWDSDPNDWVGRLKFEYSCIY